MTWTTIDLCLAYTLLEPLENVGVLLEPSEGVGVLFEPSEGTGILLEPSEGICFLGKCPHFTIEGST